MDFNFTPEQNALRERVREFVKNHPPEQYPLERSDEGWGYGGFSKEYSRLMGEADLLGVAWPKEYGGGGGSLMDLFIVRDELAYHKAPAAIHTGNTSAAFSLLENGSEELKREFLPKLCRSEVFVCQGLSEPNAGSDLLGLKTNAVKDGDDFIINGSKIWTSNAMNVDYVFLAVKTDKNLPRHKAISTFLVDLSLPGITISNIKNMTGEDAFAEVVFEDVRVPQKYLLGELNKGLGNILNALEGDRFWARSVRASATQRQIEDLVEYCKTTNFKGRPLLEDPDISNRLVNLSIKTDVCRAITYRTIALMERGPKLTYEASVLSLFADHLGTEVAETYMKILGPSGQIIGNKDLKHQKYIDTTISQWLFAPGLLIGGGTSQMQRNTIALRGLMLPRG